MKLVPQTTQQQRIIKAALGVQIDNAAAIPLGIHEADQMYAHSLHCLSGAQTPALVEYFTTGLRILNVVTQIVTWHCRSFAPIGSFLDFACGYGRFTRFLLQRLAPDRIWVADIYARAVEFQREYFGVNGIVSVTNPAEFSADQQFDCILASSFFTHVPEATFDAWLQRLYGLLKPEGVLIFSVLDMHHLPEEQRGGRPLHFVPGSYDSELPARDFGRTYVEEAHIRNVLRDRGAGIRRVPLGTDFHLDIYVITNRPQRWETELDFAYPPQAYHGVWRTRTGDWHIEGWASDHYNTNGGIAEIRLIINGEVKQRCTPDIDRPDVAQKLNNPAATRSGWCFTVPGAMLGANDIALIEVVNNRGVQTVMYCEAPEPPQ
jgi:SAM-dependent methyltransferase